MQLINVQWACSVEKFEFELKMEEPLLSAPKESECLLSVATSSSSTDDKYLSAYTVVQMKCQKLKWIGDYCSSCSREYKKEPELRKFNIIY